VPTAPRQYPGRVAELSSRLSSRAKRGTCFQVWPLPLWRRRFACAPTKTPRPEAANQSRTRHSRGLLLLLPLLLPSQSPFAIPPKRTSLLTHKSTLCYNAARALIQMTPKAAARDMLLPPLASPGARISNRHCAIRNNRNSFPYIKTLDSNRHKTGGIPA